jgi:hypothetical protein
MIFLVNRLGEVNSIALPFLEQLDHGHLLTLMRACVWCSTWSGACEWSRRRKKALELLKAR